MRLSVSISIKFLSQPLPANNGPFPFITTTLLSYTYPLSLLLLIRIPRSSSANRWMLSQHSPPPLRVIGEGHCSCSLVPCSVFSFFSFCTTRNDLHFLSMTPPLQNHRPELLSSYLHNAWCPACSLCLLQRLPTRP